MSHAVRPASGDEPNDARLINGPNLLAWLYEIHQERADRGSSAIAARAQSAIQRISFREPFDRERGRMGGAEQARRRGLTRPSEPLALGCPELELR
jgi:hypothetical protein